MRPALSVVIRDICTDLDFLSSLRKELLERGRSLWQLSRILCVAIRPVSRGPTAFVVVVVVLKFAILKCLKSPLPVLARLLPHFHHRQHLCCPLYPVHPALPLPPHPAA